MYEPIATFDYQSNELMIKWKMIHGGITSNISKTMRLKWVCNVIYVYSVFVHRNNVRGAMQN